MLAAHYQDSEDVDIFFISRGENLKAIKEFGLEIKKSFKKTIAIPTLATDNPAEIGPVDYLLCCTKSYDLEENIRHLKPVISPETVRIWKGCVYIGARLVSPGYIEKFTLKDRLFFGLNGKDKEQQLELRNILSSARVLSTNPEDIDLEIWKKFFMISTAATITSYFNEPINSVIENHIDLFITLGYELKDVAEAKGIKLPEDIVFSSIQAQKMMPNGATTSMHSDFKRGGQTEIETLTGYVIREAEALGLDVPTYRFMYNGLTQFPYPQ